MTDEEKIKLLEERLKMLFKLMEELIKVLKESGGNDLGVGLVSNSKLNDFYMIRKGAK